MSNPNVGTTSLDNALQEIVIIHGREFQQYSLNNRIYLCPIDDDEIDRLELQHQVFNLVFDNRLIFPPIRNPRRVLDCGYGAGNWALEVAERYPHCQVIGVDISPHMQPLDIPDNLWLQVDNLNRPFTFPSRHFDLVHSRLVASGLDRSRWSSYIRDLVRVTKRGGWVQMAEISFNVQSDNGSITDRHALREWSRRYMRALEDLKDLRVAPRLASLMTAAGLQEVDMRMIQLPLSAWSSDPRSNQIGALNRSNIHQLLESLALYPLTHRLHMTLDDFDSLIQRARAEVDDHTLKVYFPLYVAIGRKPL
ncbi:hypothetical protein ZTR_10930 [Talaromyces verruculosus]|nr:hypothetical protein ZTR_10930 [Talaromyces verruculosus]